MILKQGSRSELVKQLQEFLGLKADGIFGKATHQQVVRWQLENGLLGDGVVGPKTWSLMGLATTDRKEVLVDNGNVFTYQKRHLKEGEWFEGPTKKEWIFLHHTAGWENPFNTISGWEGDTRGKIATEWVVGGKNIRNSSDDFDGQIVQAFPTHGWGWHLGTGDNIMHQCSIGIEICSFGGLTYEFFLRKNPKTKKMIRVEGKKNTYYTYTGVECDPSQIEILEKPFRGHIAWHRYSTKQIEATMEIILEISKRDGIDPKRGIIEQIHKRGAFEAFDTTDIKLCQEVKGMWLHTNVRVDKNDLYPCSQMIEMLLSI